MMASNGEQFSQLLTERSLIAFSGEVDEQLDFLQSLITNDAGKADAQTLIYAALLTPQGKYLSDFLIFRDGDGNFMLDVATPLAADLLKRLSMYRLRRPVTFGQIDMPVQAIWGGDAPETGLRDPRHPDLGWRAYGDTPVNTQQGDYDLHRLTLGVPEGGIDLLTNDTYILEAGFEDMHGVDFRKGCYVGQEVVARMKHKTDLRKGVQRVYVTGQAERGTELFNDEGKAAGILLSHRDGVGLAHIRFDRFVSDLSDKSKNVNVARLKI